MCWERRHEQPPQFPAPSEAIATARAARLRRKLGCVTMADASDVVTAGAPGDSTHLLRALLEEAQGLLTYAAVRDPQRDRRRCGRARSATSSRSSIGGDARSGAARRRCRCAARSSASTIATASAAPSCSRSSTCAIVITEGPSMVMRPSFYTEVGLDPWKADIVMVKNFFPFLMFFLPYNRKTIFVRTRGTTDFDAAFQLPFDGPMHPRDRGRRLARRAIALRRGPDYQHHSAARLGDFLACQ